MGGLIFAVHDLVRVDKTLATRFDDAPAWVASSLDRSPWMVVRRGCFDEHIAVGVRGLNRSERFGSSINVTDVRAHVVPEDLCAAATRFDGKLGDAARRISAYAQDIGLEWGPVGSFGFELASGTPITTAASDLDVVVRAIDVARDRLFAFHRAQAMLSATLELSIDVVLEFDVGGIALSEFAAKNSRVIAKTAWGPKLVPCP